MNRVRVAAVSVVESPVVIDVEDLRDSLFDGVLVAVVVVVVVVYVVVDVVVDDVAVVVI